MQIRKVTKATVFYQSEIADLDMEDFRNHEDRPFQGSTEEDFLDYLREFDFDNTYGLSEDTVEQLRKIYEPELTEYYSTSSDFEDAYLEIGERDPAARKSGGFVCREAITL